MVNPPELNAYIFIPAGPAACVRVIEPASRRATATPEIRLTVVRFIAALLR
jgi:hypothetical protein